MTEQEIKDAKNATIQYIKNQMLNCELELKRIREILEKLEKK